MLGLPLAARNRKEVPAIHMNGRGDLLERIRDRMDDKLTQRGNVFSIESLGSNFAQSAVTPAIKGIFFPASVNSDNRPHPMVMGIQIYARSHKTLRIVS